MFAYLVILAGVAVVLVFAFLWIIPRSKARRSARGTAAPVARDGLTKSEAEDMLDWMENRSGSAACEVNVKNGRFTVRPRKMA